MADLLCNARPGRRTGSWIVVMFLISCFSFVQGQEKYKQIRVFVPDRVTLETIWSSGIDFEGTTGKPGGVMEFVASNDDLKRLASHGINYDIVVDDLASHYEQRLVSGPQNPLGFGFGSMGGFYTYDEVVRQLDTMRLQYPSLISQRDSIGRTVEGRAIWAVKISDNPSINEPGEPEVLYTALHHAREPEGMMTLIYYMWWLLQNYATNTEAAYLVNNRQMWFIPVVNPDGYVYNQTTNPNGGGMHRKNRQPVGTTNLGVDLNRNYGPMYMWNASNGGSSTSSNDDTYRGSAPFSEPETQTIDAFMRAHAIKTCLNYHTYGNYLIYPWGYLSRENADSLVYRDWAYDMTFDNHFTNGTDQQTVAYSTRGNSDDYMFGDTTKSVTYTMTPEVGTTGFWPTTGEILPLAVMNLRQNQLLAHVAGQYTTLRSYGIVDADGNGYPDRGENFTFRPVVRNRGLSAASNLAVTLSTNSPDIHVITSSIVLSSLAAQRDSMLAFSAYVESNATTGVPVQFYLAYTDFEGYSRLDTVQIFIGTPTILFADSANAGTSNWNTGQGWGTTANAHTPPLAFTDSPSGVYLANANNSLTLINQINLAGYNYAQLRFWTKWSVEPTWDFATVEVSSNNGTTWTTLRTRLSHFGSARSGSQQPSGSWGFESYTPGLTWIEQDADLSSYVNSQIKIRFRMAADGGDQRDGIYVDDIRILGYTVNANPLPATPALAVPPNGSVNQQTSLVLGWHTASNATGYTLQVAVDSLFNAIVMFDSTLTDTTRQVNSLANSTRYFWRVRARNGAGSGPFSTAWSFRTLPSVPAMPALLLPVNGSAENPPNLAFVWHSDPDAEFYHLQISIDSLFGTTLLSDSALTDTTRGSVVLPAGSILFWRVRAKNVAGIGAWSQVWSFATANQVTRQYAVTSGWNMLSVPLVSADMRKSSLYPNASSAAFAFVQGQGYLPTDTLVNGAGYWVKFPGAGNITLTGSVITRDTIPVWAGWNLIGGISEVVDTSSIIQVPPGIIRSAYFGYNGSYVPGDSIRPGTACWVKCGSNGYLIFGMPVTSTHSKDKRQPELILKSNAANRKVK